MQLNSLERSILEWIARRHPSLSADLDSAEVHEREHTGVGFYVNLIPEAEKPWDSPPLSGPHIVSASLEFGGGALLWLVEGRPACLEIFAYGDRFPAELDEFEVITPPG